MKKYLINYIPVFNTWTGGMQDFIYETPTFTNLQGIKDAIKNSLDDFYKKEIRSITITDIKLLDL